MRFIKLLVLVNVYIADFPESAMKKSSIFKNKSFIALMAVSLVAIIVLAIYIIPSSNNKNSTLKIENSAVLGDANAPVTIYEFSDFSCPFCEAAEGKNSQVEDYLKSRSPGWEAPVPLIRENYVKTGKVKIVFKYFPGHGAAVTAHAVALGVKEQNPDLFWEFADKAFAEPAENLNDLGKMKSLAVSIGADESELSKYIESNTFINQLQAETEMGLNNSVSGTPTFFINGQKVEGAQPFSAFKDIIDKELAR